MPYSWMYRKQKKNQLIFAGAAIEVEGLQVLPRNVGGALVKSGKMVAKYVAWETANDNSTWIVTIDAL